MARRADEDIALDLKGILLAVWRRKLFVAAVTIAVGAGAFGLLSAMSPTFEAETKLLIENREPPLSPNPVMPNDRETVDAETVASQVQLLTSRDLARQVAEKNHLADVGEFEGTQPGKLQSLLALVGIGRDRLRVSPEERVVDAFIERLKVFQVDGSRVITVQFRSTDRVLAATLANSVAEEYLALQSEAKRRTSADQTRWLGDEIGKLRAKVREADEAVEKYRAEKDLLTGTNNTSVARQQITDLTNSIAAARSDKAAADSKAKILSALLKGNGDIENATDVLDGDSFRTLRSRMIALRSRLSELSVTLLPGHPQIKAVQSQIADVHIQEIAEARRMLASLQNDAAVAAARIATLQDGLNQLKVASAADGESEVQLSALQRDAASQRTLLDGLLARYREATARQNADVLPADARVISRASTPVSAAFPKVLQLSIVATLAGFLLSVAWVIAGEFLSGRALTRLPLPMAPPRVVEGVPPNPPVPAAAVAEPFAAAAGQAEAPTWSERAAAIRAARTAPVAEPDAADDGDPRVARFRARVSAAAAAAAADTAGDRPSDPVRAAAGEAALSVVTVDSVHALLIGDGATRVAVVGVGSASAVERVIDGMARRATADGARVVVVDTVASHAGIGGAGLSDLLSGGAEFADIIRRNAATRAHEIGVGSVALPSETWAGPEIETMLDALEHTYDLVVIDLGLMQSDAGRFRLIAAADHALLVGDADDPDTRRAHALLARAGVGHLSVVPTPEGDAAAVA